jgi:chloramphenicol-sensitive protein RarD
MATQKTGITYGILAYIIWGLLPMYWKLLDDVDAEIVLSHRILWSFGFMLIFILFGKRWTLFIAECRAIFHNKKILFIITTASVIISANWLVFIWAVQHDRVIQTSLGYYINPLVSILLGVIFLKERLSKIQVISCILAAIGVTYLTIDYGVFPWISLFLAVSFALYGLLKKVANINATFSLAIETMIITPVTLLYLLIFIGPTIGFQAGSMGINSLLLLCGVVTAIPLLLFGNAVLYIPLSMVGFLQYIAPTLMLLIGVFLYGEPFTKAHLITFIFIWISLMLYMSGSFMRNKQRLKTH